MLKKLVYKIVPKTYARLPLSADDRVIEQLVVGNQMLTEEKQEKAQLVLLLRAQCFPSCTSLLAYIC